MKKERKAPKSVTWRRAFMFSPRQLRILKFLLVACLVLIFYLSAVIILDNVSNMIHPLCQNDVFNQASELTKGDNNETNNTLTIANWVSKNIKWGTLPHCKSNFAVFIPDNNSVCRTLTIGCGACGEKAELISSMLNSIGIEAVRVSGSCRDHAWNEAKINNEWVFFDATGDGGVLDFNMSKKDFGKETTLCNVTAYYPNGTSFDVTWEYKPLTSI